MSVIHAELAESFYFGDDAVLLAMDTVGVDLVLEALSQARRDGTARLDHGATSHQFRIEPDAASIDLHDNTIVWRLDTAKAAEIIELLTTTHGRSSAGHHYVDINTPAKTLVLSRNEYLDKL